MNIRSITPTKSIMKGLSMRMKWNITKRKNTILRLNTITMMNIRTQKKVNYGSLERNVRADIPFHLLTIKVIGL